MQSVDMSIASPHSLVVSVLWDLVDFCSENPSVNFAKILAEKSGGTAKTTLSERHARLCKACGSAETSLIFHPWSFRDHGNWAAALALDEGEPENFSRDWLEVCEQMAALSVPTPVRDVLGAVCLIRSFLCLQLCEDERPSDLYSWEWGYDNANAYEQEEWHGFFASSLPPEAFRQFTKYVEFLSKKGRKKLLNEVSKLPDVSCSVDRYANRRRIFEFFNPANRNAFIPTVNEIVNTYRRQRDIQDRKTVKTERSRMPSSTTSVESDNSERGARKVRPEASRHAYQAYRKSSEEAFMSGNMKMAAAYLSRLLSQPELLNTGNDALFARFCCAYAQSENEDASPADLKDALKDVENYSTYSGGGMFPIAYVLRSRICVRMHDYDGALKSLGWYRLAVEGGSTFQSVCFPGTKEPLEFGTLDFAEREFKRLTAICERPPAADKRCQWTECQKPDMYFAYRFKGYNEVVCTWKCCLAYHPDCFKSAVAAGVLIDVHDVAKGIQKECPTPDCRGVIDKESIYKADGSLKTSNELPRSETCAPPSPTKKSKQRTKERNRDSQKHHKHEQHRVKLPELIDETDDIDPCVSDSGETPKIDPKDFSRPMENCSEDWILSQLEEPVADTSVMTKLPNKFEAEEAGFLGKKQKHGKKRRDKKDTTIFLGPSSYADAEASHAESSLTEEPDFQLNPEVQRFLDDVVNKLTSGRKLLYDDVWLNNTLGYNPDVSEAFDKLGGWQGLFRKRDGLLFDQFGVTLAGRVSSGGSSSHVTSEIHGNDLAERLEESRRESGSSSRPDSQDCVQTAESISLEFTTASLSQTLQVTNISDVDSDKTGVETSKPPPALEPMKRKPKLRLKPEFRSKPAGGGDASGTCDPQLIAPAAKIKLEGESGVLADPGPAKPKIKLTLKRPPVKNSESIVVQSKSQSGIPESTEKDATVHSEARRRLDKILAILKERFEGVYNRQELMSFLRDYKQSGKAVRGVSAEEIANGLTKYVWDVQTVDTCAICKCRNDEETVSEQKCRHRFHTDCIRKWTAINSTCPICRTHIVDEKDFPPLGVPT